MRPAFYYGWIGIVFLLLGENCYAQPVYKKGILKEEFIYEKAPFPSCHASTIAETPRGLVAAWFGGSHEGSKDVCIWTSLYINNAWTSPALAADGVINDSLRYACYNPVLYQVPGGELLLFYKIGPNVEGWTGWIKRSKDNGISWSTGEALPPGILGPIKNKPISVNGALLCPSSTENNGWKVHMEYSDDWGRSWTKSANIDHGAAIGVIQPALLQYRDGRLQAMCRSMNRAIYTSWSRDNGKTWTAMQATSLPSNNSGIDAVTLRDGRQLLVCNYVKPPDSLAEGRGARTPLNVLISNDGKQWLAAAVLEDGPGEYSYPSVIQIKRRNGAYCVHMETGKDKAHHARSCKIADQAHCKKGMATINLTRLYCQLVMIC